MSLLAIFAVVSMLCALVPAVLFLINLALYRPPPAATMPLPPVSVLIPARDEAHGIVEAVRSVLASKDVELEVIVMDDGSTDGTVALVRALAFEDSRVHLEFAPALPAGWNGKQHACWALASAARFDVLCFIDADVRIEPQAIARMAGFLQQTQAGLVSGFPRQVTESWLESLLLPLIHFVLLGFLPIARMRETANPAYAAGCGQFAMVTRSAYLASGGHAAIRRTMHDGLMLPKLLRQHGFRTDLADITDLARCRMYHNAHEVWQGLAKNATEGLGAPARIGPISLLLLMGQVVPFGLLLMLAFSHRVFSPPGCCVVVAVLAAWLPRLLSVFRFRQPIIGALLHPFGILTLLGVQWYALLRRLRGGAVSWRNRAYAR